jgi:hypothetical protein
MTAAAGSGSPPIRPDAAPTTEQPAVSGGAERLKIIGGLVALGSGLLAIVLVVIVALIVEPDTAGGSIATSAIGVVGSIVGAYFGIKIGTDGTNTAITAQQKEATKAQVLALHTPPEKAETVLKDIQQLL